MTQECSPQTDKLHLAHRLTVQVCISATERNQANIRIPASSLIASNAWITKFQSCRTELECYNQEPCLHMQYSPLIFFSSHLGKRRSGWGLPFHACCYIVSASSDSPSVQMVLLWVRAYMGWEWAPRYSSKTWVSSILEHRPRLDITCGEAENRQSPN